MSAGNKHPAPCEGSSQILSTATPTPHGAPELPPLPVRYSYQLELNEDDLTPDDEIDVFTADQMREYARAAIQQAAGAVPEDMSCPGCLVGTLQRRLLKSKNRVLAAKVCDNCKIELFGQEQSEYNKNSRDVSTPSPLGREAGKEGSSDHLVGGAGGGVQVPLLFSRRKGIADKLGVQMTPQFNAIVRAVELAHGIDWRPDAPTSQINQPAEGGK